MKNFLYLLPLLLTISIVKPVYSQTKPHRKLVEEINQCLISGDVSISKSGLVIQRNLTTQTKISYNLNDITNIFYRNTQNKQKVVIFYHAERSINPSIEPRLSTTLLCHSKKAALKVIDNFNELKKRYRHQSNKEASGINIEVSFNNSDSIDNNRRKKVPLQPKP